MAIMMLIIWQQHEMPMLPAACGVHVGVTMPALVWQLTSSFGVSMPNMLKLLLFGATQFGLGIVFLTVGGQMVSATQNALINTLETPLAVAWVWVCFSEAPSIANFAGGMIVMAAVVGHVWHSNRGSPLPLPLEQGRDMMRS